MYGCYGWCVCGGTLYCSGERAFLSAEGETARGLLELCSSVMEEAVQSTVLRGACLGEEGAELLGLWLGLALGLGRGLLRVESRTLLRNGITPASFKDMV